MISEPQKRYYMIIACMILGILVALQFKTQSREGFPIYSQRTQELTRIINDLEKDRNVLQLDLARSRDRLKEYETAAAKGESLMQAVNKELELRRIESGIIEVTGPGLIVQLLDSTNKPKTGDDPYFFIIHDIDLLTLVNELWASGAEAISINGQRLVTDSSIRCAGPVIYVNTERLAPPYEVRAIGPASKMEVTLKMPGGFLDSMQASIQHGVKININKQDNILVEAFKGGITFRYAKPISE